MSKEVWLWKYCGKCQIEKPWPRAWISCLATRVINTILSKKQLYRLIVYIQSWCNSGRFSSYKLINTFVDYISQEQLDTLAYHPFGPTQIMAPKDIRQYMRKFRRYTDEEAALKGGHAPYKIRLK